jgi:hypothetical protein
VSLLQLPGPLSAVVKAQAQSAMTTVDFINAVGFHNENRSVINVDFKYSGVDDKGQDIDRTLTVPFLAMLPIPSIEVCAAAVCPTCVRACVRAPGEAQLGAVPWCR